MPPAFILSQDQTLHYKKFDTPGRLTGRFQFLGGNLRPSTRPAQVRALRSKELNCLSIASYCAARFPRNVVAFGRLHYFITGFGFCKSPRRFFVNFFRSPRGDSDIPSGDILKLSRLSVFASGPGDFFRRAPGRTARLPAFPACPSPSLSGTRR